MATADVVPPPAEAAPALPDYLVDPNAVLGDTADWRYGRAPDYSNTRRVYEETKTKSHEAASLPNLVENLVKNWEVEASFKSNINDWRTIDRPNYTFAINGGPPQSAEHMLKVGTYNAIIAPNQYYSPENSDFATSHKTFKRMMPTFAWEVLEVYSGPPVVAFRWRHWGTMKNDYVGFNDKGEKVTAKAHGGAIDIQGVTIAKVDDRVRLQSVETWFDPLEMFRQIAPKGIVNKTIVTPKDATSPSPANEKESAVEKKEVVDASLSREKVSHNIEEKKDGLTPHILSNDNQAVESKNENVTSESSADAKQITEEKKDSSPTPLPETSSQDTEEKEEDAPSQSIESNILITEKKTENVATQPSVKDTQSPVPVNDESTQQVFNKDYKLPAEEKKDMVTASGAGIEEKVSAEHEQKLEPGAAVVEPKDSEEVTRVHEEMSRIGISECPFLMNRE